MTDHHQTLAAKFAAALAAERAEDVAQAQTLLATLPAKALARRGLAVLNLAVANVRTTVGGGVVVELEPDAAFAPEGPDTAQAAAIRAGDIVAVERMPSATEKRRPRGAKNGRSGDGAAADTAGGGRRVEGVVARVGHPPGAVVVAVDERDADQAADLDGRLWVVKLANNATYARLADTMARLDALRAPTRLQQVLLGTATATDDSADGAAVAVLDGGLNAFQRAAVALATGPSELAIVHGPPGTGKTATVVEIVRQLAGRGQRVLVCAPSNVAADTVLERLHGTLDAGRLLRVGHPARLLPATRAHSLDLLLRTSEAGALARDIAAEIDGLLASVRKTRSGRERGDVYRTVRALRKEYRVREQRALREMLTAAGVVVCTLHGAGTRFLQGIEFDAIVIDEVSQALEAQCWIPLLQHPEARRLVIAGDSRQLPPTIKAAKNTATLGRTLFDRLEAVHGRAQTRLLAVQYRMHADIMAFPSAALYGGQLVAADAVAGITLADLPGVAATDATTAPVVWLDTQGGDFDETVPADDADSRSNDLEAWAVVRHVAELVGAGVAPADIGVVSPYSAQVALVARRVRAWLARHAPAADGAAPALEVATVDGFQGREKEAIVLTLVRSNADGAVGFLAEDRRLNVAMTRPRRHLCVVGDMETLARGTTFLRRWTDWAGEHADLVYPDVGDVLAFAMAEGDAV
ncbi:P-loop containing nucleoside triphosphate hydrolase protein [Dipodascopsis tothii]|uniref:P-loop containing nucleoside triphosphate hydrolase protein n=1 Tax=Dipodascopsis tothii TaxID=44089 RepID=UPI0034CD50D1